MKAKRSPMPRRDPRLADLSDELYAARQRLRWATTEERRAHWSAEIARLTTQRDEVRLELGLPPLGANTEANRGV